MKIVKARNPLRHLVISNQGKPPVNPEVLDHKFHDLQLQAMDALYERMTFLADKGISNNDCTLSNKEDTAKYRKTYGTMLDLRCIDPLARYVSSAVNCHDGVCCKHTSTCGKCFYIWKRKAVNSMFQWLLSNYTLQDSFYWVSRKERVLLPRGVCSDRSGNRLLCNGTSAVEDYYKFRTYDVDHSAYMFSDMLAFAKDIVIPALKGRIFELQHHNKFEGSMHNLCVYPTYGTQTTVTWELSSLFLCNLKLYQKLTRKRRCLWTPRTKPSKIWINSLQNYLDGYPERLGKHSGAYAQHTLHLASTEMVCDMEASDAKNMQSVWDVVNQVFSPSNYWRMLDFLPVEFLCYQSSRYRGETHLRFTSKSGAFSDQEATQDKPPKLENSG